MAHIVLNTLNSTASACDLSGSVPPRYMYITGGGSNTTTLAASSNYTLSVTFGPDVNQYFGAWIDYNQDGSFASNEFLGASGNAGSNGTVSVSFTIPPDAKNGVTRIRIIGGNDDVVLSTQACGASSGGWGETQDYDVTITGGIAPYVYLWSESPASGTLTSTSTNPTGANGITVPETYSVTVTSPTGCSATSSAPVTVFTPLVCTGISHDIPCRYTNFNVTANTTGGGNLLHYSWSDPLHHTYPDAKTVVANLPAGTYTISVTITDECGTSCSMSKPISVGNFPGGTAIGAASGQTYQGLDYYVFDYTPGSTFQWEVSETDCNTGFSPISGAVTDEITWTPTGAGTFYLHCVVVGANGCQTTSTCVTTVVTGQGDDVCAALTLHYGLNGPFTNAGATTQPGEPVPPATGCTTQTGWCTSNISNSVWFKFTAPASGRISLGNDPHFNLWNNQFALYSVADCNDFNTFTLVAANDDSTQSMSPYSAWIAPICLVPGQVYYLQVDGFESTVNPAWGIRLTDEGNNAPVISGCPSNIEVPANAAGCTANVSWTAPTAEDPDACFTPLSFTSNHNPGDNFPLGTTTVTYTANDGFNPDVHCTFTVTVVSSAVPSISGDLSICQGSTNTLDAGDFVSYVWSTTETSRTIDVSTAGTFTVTVTDANGCTGTSTVTTTIDPLPNAIAGIDRAICLHESTQLGADAVPGSTYSWISVPAGYTSNVSNPTVSPDVTTTYILTETITATGCTNSHSVTVTVNPLPDAVAGVDRSICLNGNTQLGTTAVLGNTYKWTSDPAGYTSTEADPTVSPNQTTTYTLTETITATGCVNSHSVTVTVHPLPDAVVGSDHAICLNETTQIGATAVPGNTYNWTSVPAGFTSTVADPTVSPTETTTYTLTETIPATGCQNSHSVIITVNPLPAAVTGADHAICLEESTNIGAPGVSGNSYSWSSVPVGFTSNEANPTVSPNVTTTYTLVETIIETGCSNTHSVTVTVNPLPAAYAGTDREVCYDQPAQLGAPAVPGNTYSWISVPAGFTSTEADPTLYPVADITYTLTETVVSTGCTNTNSVSLTVNPLPESNLPIYPADITVCVGAGTNIVVENSVAGTNYQLKLYYNGAPVGPPVPGNGGTILLPTGPLAVTTDFAIQATIVATGCTDEINDDLRVIVGGPHSDLGDVHVCNGTSTVDIPVTVTDFNQVGSLSLSFGYNPSELASPTVISRNPAFEGEWDPFVETTSPAGLFRVSGYGALPGNEVNLSDGATLFTIRFNILSGTTSSAVTFVENTQGTGLEYTLGAPDYIPFCDTATGIYYMNGSVTVNPEAVVDDPGDQVICNGDHYPGTVFSSSHLGSYTYDWTNDNTSIGLGASGTGDLPEFNAVNSGLSPEVATITVTPTLNMGGINCVGAPITFTITVNPSGQVNDPTDVVVCPDGSIQVHFTSNNSGGTTTYQWTNDNTSIGLAASGSGDIGPFNGQNSGLGPNVATIEVVPFFTNGGSTCPGSPEIFTITVNPTGNVLDPTDEKICNGEPVTVYFTSGNTGGTTTYSWSNDNTSIGLPDSGQGDNISFTTTNTGYGPTVANVTVTPHFEYAGVTCDGPPETFAISVFPSGQVNDPTDLVVCNFDFTPTITFTSNNTGGTTTFDWTNDNPLIGLAPSGSGPIGQFLAMNGGTEPIVATITVTPTFNYPSFGDDIGVHCPGTPETFTITVNPSGQVNNPGNLTVCNGASTSVNFSTLNIGGTTTYEWVNDNPEIGLASSGSGDISFTATNSVTTPLVANIGVTPIYENEGVGCNGQTQYFTITVNPTGGVYSPYDVFYCNGDVTDVYEFTTMNTGGNTTYTWTNSRPDIGLQASGTGPIPSFVAVNSENWPIMAEIVVTPHFEFNGVTCDGPSDDMYITVNPVAQVLQPASQVVCKGDLIPGVTFSTSNTAGVVTYEWVNDNPSIGLIASGSGDIPPFIATNLLNHPIIGVITVTPTFTSYLGYSCPGPSKQFTITVNPLGQVDPVSDVVVCEGSGVSEIAFTTTNTGGNTTYNWTNDHPEIGLAASGDGNILAFTAVNTTNDPIVATITVTPVFEKESVGCNGTEMTFTITVNPSAKVLDPTDLVVCNGEMTGDIHFDTPSLMGTTTFTWVNDLPSIGLPASGSGDILSFAAVNNGTSPVTATITVSPHFEYNDVTCDGSPETFTITVNPTAQVGQPGNQVVCNGDLTDEVVFTTQNTGGVATYEWVVDNSSVCAPLSGDGNFPAFTACNTGLGPQVATITVTPYFSHLETPCSGDPKSFTITVNPTPTMSLPSDQTVCNGNYTTAVHFTSANTGGTVTYTWTNTDPSIGLAANGEGDIASFQAVNTGNAMVTASIWVTPHYTNAGVTCDGVADHFEITVKPSGQVNQPDDVVACFDEDIQVDFTTTNTGSTTYQWTNDNTTIGLGASGMGSHLIFTAANPYTYPISATITVTPYYYGAMPTSGGKPPMPGCAGPSKSFTITVNPLGQVDQPASVTYSNNDVTAPINFSTVNTGGTTTYAWTNDTPGIGLAATGTGNIGTFTAVNLTVNPVIATVTVTPTFTYEGVSCQGENKVFTITVDPKPILVITNQSSCSPTKINLTAPGVTAGSFLPTGTVLSYWMNAGATTPVPNPAAVGSGTYYIKATIVPGGWFDIKPVVAIVGNLPTVYSGLGSGTYCANVPNITVGISGSQVGVDYWLFNGLVQISPVGIHGTGGPIYFDPIPPVAGTYWVFAENVTTGCINRMYDCIHLEVTTPVAVSVSINPSANPVAADLPVTFSAVPSHGGTTPVYQWKVNGFNTGTNSPTFTYVPVNGDEVTCVLTSSETCTTGNPATSNIVVMTVTGVPVGNITVTGQVSGYDTKCYNSMGTITVAGGGTTFVVNSGSSATFIAGVKILFEPGTMVLSGGYMRGYISTTDHCGVKAPAVPSTIASGDETPAVSLQAGFRIYPNPTTGNFVVEQTSGDARENVKVEVYGMRGDRVLSGQISNETKHEFSVSGFPAGLYFVKIVSGTDAETIKLIKTN